MSERDDDDLTDAEWLAKHGTPDPCTKEAHWFGCTCTLSPVNSASIDPPHEVINRDCPLHGNAPDPDDARDLAMENDRLDRLIRDYEDDF